MNFIIQIGCYEISLGDTIGVGTVDKTKHLMDTLKEGKVIPFSNYAVHFHDTYDRAIENILVSL
jgi:hydroxymethylglutaryl-CoA lyase